jgi:hypothetical protein
MTSGDGSDQTDDTDGGGAQAEHAHADRWRRNRWALVELAALVGLTVLVLATVGAKAAELPDGCPSIVKFELAVPEERLPDQASGLVTIEDIADCGLPSPSTTTTTPPTTSAPTTSTTAAPTTTSTPPTTATPTTLAPTTAPPTTAATTAPTTAPTTLPSTTTSTSTTIAGIGLADPGPPTATPIAFSAGTGGGATDPADEGEDDDEPPIPANPALTEALVKAVEADYIFIVLYSALLLWAGLRMAGQSPGPLARVDRGERSRQLALIAYWSVPVIAVVDIVENVGLERTAHDLPNDIEPTIVQITAGAAAAKWVLVVFPVVLALVLLVRLAQAGIRSKAADAVRRAVILPRPGPGDRHGPDAEEDPEEAQGYRWALPTFTPPGQFVVPDEKSDDESGAATDDQGNVITIEIDDPLLGIASNPTLRTPSGQLQPLDRYGICLSGGGIRSATFSLGALQALEATDAERAGWSITRARYLSAVSGGSYMAASYQLLAHEGEGAPDVATEQDSMFATTLRQRFVAWTKGEQNAAWRRNLAGAFDRVATWITGIPPQPTTDPGKLPLKENAPTGPLVPPAGVVEDHYRRHATHLADGAGEWTLALGEVLLRSLSSVLVVLLAVVAVALPLGWLFRYVFYGLSDSLPDPALDLRIVIGPLIALAVYFVLRWPIAARLDAAERGRTDVAVSDARDRRDEVRGAAAFGVTLLVLLAIVLPFLTNGMNSLVFEVGKLLGIAEEPADQADVEAQLDDIIAGTTEAARGAALAATVDLPGATSPADAGLAAAASSARLAAARAARAAEDLEEAAIRGRELPAEDTDGADAPAPAEPESAIDESSPAAAACPAATFTAEDGTTADAQQLLDTARQACVAATAAAAATASVAEYADRLADQGSPVDAAPALALTRAAERSVQGATDAAEATDELASALAGSGGTALDAPKAFAALTALVTIVNGLRAKRKSDVGQRPTPPSDGTKKDKNAIARTLGFGGLGEVIAGVVTALVLFIFFSDLVVDAWRRGARGDGVVGDIEVGFVRGDAIWWWVGAVGLLAFLTAWVNVNRWSWRPFYHRRLWLPYAVTPAGKTVDWQVDTRLSAVGRKVEGRPELLVCAAAQTSGRDWAPPGRRAVSYVMTANMCGGPEVGYIDTPTLEALLGRQYRDTVTLFGAVTSSGAAFGPAMGRHSKGGLGAPMAIANARLGAWLPNPHHLAALAEARAGDAELRAGALSRRPRLWYWVMEIVGQYPMDAKMVQVTDGGHVENLGLVELLRRRCSRILCFDASGAGATPTTLAEAIVLARDELGVEIELLPSSEDRQPDVPTATTTIKATTTRSGPTTTTKAETETVGPPTSAPSLLDVDNCGADPLGRRITDVEALARRLAKRPVIVAKIIYPEVTFEGTTAERFEGWLIYGTLALANASAKDWDVLEYAQRHPEFPNDGTDRQWFESDVFAAYQHLGRCTAERMIDTARAYGIRIPPPP